MTETLPVTLLTGKPHIGKSTVIQKIVELAASSSGGFYTREVHANGQRTGFEIITLGGQSALLATKNPNTIFTNQIYFGSYKIDLNVVDRVVVPALLEAVDSKKLVIIDEIGPMEIFSENFCNAVLNIINDPRLVVVGTVVQRSYKFADMIKAHPRVTIKLVTFENRDSLPAMIYSDLEKYLYV